MGMTDTLIHDNETLQAALAKADGPSVEVSFSRETAEFVAQLLDASAHGQKILLVEHGDEISPTDAAPLLGMSRPQVRKLMDEGRLEHRMVGSHHRIKVTSVQAFIAAEQKRGMAAMAKFTALQNALGLTE